MKKICLISGGAFGIGFSIAKKFSLSNYHVIIADNNKKKLLQCKKNFKIGSFFYCDISEEKSILDLKKAILNEFGCYPTLLINNAAIVRFGDILEHSYKDFRSVIDVNLIGTFLMSKEFGKEMVKNNYGNIINITSINAIAPSPDAGAYPSSKAGVVKLTEQLAISLGPRGVRVNSVAPGFINDGMSKPIYNSKKVLRERAKDVPLQRIGLAEDIASVVKFLSSDDASYIHGQHIIVDGGVTKSLKMHLKRKTPENE